MSYITLIKSINLPGLVGIAGNYNIEADAFELLLSLEGGRVTRVAVTWEQGLALTRATPTTKPEGG